MASIPSPAVHPRQIDARRFSHWAIFVLLGLAAWLHLVVPLLASLGTYLALSRLRFSHRIGKRLAVLIFLVIVAGLGSLGGHLIRQAVHALPDIADRAIPSAISWAEAHNTTLPFYDYESLKQAAMQWVQGEAHYLGNVASIAGEAATQFVFAIAGVIVAISLFLGGPIEHHDHDQGAPDFYSLCRAHLARRFSTFYDSFVAVMEAQVVISAVNTVLTAIFVTAMHLPYAAVVIGATFLCGLLPIVGNLISNTIVVAIGITVSPKMAILALIFLVVIHKLEYFLNSKIVGWKIHNPLWLTLLGLIIGERLMGIPGMVLAPIVLNYLRVEGTKIKVGGA